MKERVFGFKPSIIDGTERIFNTIDKIELPEKYTFKAYMPPVINQGEDSICVPCSVSTYLNWKENLKSGEVKDNKVSLFEIYDSRENDGEGMTFKDAFKYLKHKGVSSKAGKLKISAYGKINNPLALKYAIVMNGPCFGALPVYSDDYDFWNKKPGDRLLGYHAISIIGYDEEGFFIRNSWGTSFGDRGYTKIKNSELDEMLELWTIIE
jgi:hypothetical protein